MLREVGLGEARLGLEWVEEVAEAAVLDSVMLKVEDVEMEALLPWKRLERGLWPFIVATGIEVEGKEATGGRKS